MSIYDGIFKKITGIDPASLQSEEDKRDYRQIRLFFLLTSFTILVGLPGVIYMLVTVYIPELEKWW